ncbi:MAG: DUF1553 domain-containing protein [Verrucomicrobiaceae bacterium]
MSLRVVISLFCASAAILSAAEKEIYELGPPVPKSGEHLKPHERVDDLVFARLAELKLQPAHLCSDAVFVRRAFLTVIGTLPTEQEARGFVAARQPDKRAQLIEILLQRPEFVDFWSMKFGDLLRVKAEFPIKLWPNAVQAYHHFIHTAVRENRPLHVLARQLLLATGSNFREGEVNFYRAMQDRSPRGIASTVALTFMGERADKWPKKKLDAMAGFFAQVAYKSTAEWKEEIVFFNPIADKEGLTKQAIFPDGHAAAIKTGLEDPRAVFAEWLLRPDNAWFCKSWANRIWCWLMGRGIVHEPDDFRADNPPSNPALLAFLEKELAASKCDMRHLFRVILNSQAFQLSSIPVQDTPEAAANFAHYPLRRLEAEVLIDALNQITGTHEEYSSPIPEPFTFIPENVRSIALADGSITSAFLELFGRPPRDTGFEAERSRDTSPPQRLHMLNSSHVLNKIKKCPLISDVKNSDSVESIADKVYHTVLSRAPSANELATLKGHVAVTYDGGSTLAADLVWALINQPEFLFNH